MADIFNIINFTNFYKITYTLEPVENISYTRFAFTISVYDSEHVFLDSTSYIMTIFDLIPASFLTLGSFRFKMLAPL